MFAASSIGPVPPFEQLEPTDAVQVQVTFEKSAPGISLIAAPATVSGPVFDTVMVNITGSPIPALATSAVLATPRSEIVGLNSKEPLSAAAPCGRVTPRWSVAGADAALARSIAGEPPSSACVCVFPGGLRASAASIGSVAETSPVCVKLAPPELSPITLNPPDCGTSAWLSKAGVVKSDRALSATMLLRTRRSGRTGILPNTGSKIVNPIPATPSCPFVATVEFVIVKPLLLVNCALNP